MSEAEIKNRYVKLHDRITIEYYTDKTLSKKEFNVQHSKCWRDMKRELMEAGYISPPLKRYLLYTKKITTPKRIIYKSLIELEDLTPKEITQFEAEGYTVEEVT